MTTNNCLYTDLNASTNEDDEGDEVLTDDHGHNFMIIEGTRARFKDYTLLLANEVIELLNFVVVGDTTAKRSCYIVPRNFIAKEEGVVWWPSLKTNTVKPKARLQDFYSTIVKAEIPRTTLEYPYDGKTHKLIWRPYPLKAVYKDFGVYIQITIFILLDFFLRNTT